jgi:hypothetical protein
MSESAIASIIEKLSMKCNNISKVVACLNTMAIDILGYVSEK